MVKPAVLGVLIRSGVAEYHHVPKLPCYLGLKIPQSRFSAGKIPMSFAAGCSFLSGCAV